MRNQLIKYGLLFLLICPLKAGYSQIVDFTLGEIQVRGSALDYYDEDTRREVLDSLIRERFASADLGELLRYQGGIIVSSYGSRGSLSGIRIRGTGDNHTSVLWNGIPVNSITTSTIDASLIPAGFMESVSLTRGASGALAGKSSFGGVLYLENKPDWDQKLSVSLASEAGSFGYRSLMPGLVLSNDKIQYRANFQVIKSDNDFPYKDYYKAGSPMVSQKNDSLFQRGLVQNLFLKFRGNTSVDIGLWLLDKNKDIPSVMGSYQSNLAGQSDKSLKTYLRFSKLAGRNRILMQLGYINDSLIYTLQDHDNPGNYLIHSTFKTSGFYTRAEWRWFAGSRISIDIGGQSEHPKAEVDSYGSVKKENRAGIFTAAKYRYGRWIANAGIRKEFNQYNPPGPLFSFGLSRKSEDRKHMLRANISNKFRIPSFNERYWQPGGNPGLLPESGWGAEAGWRWENEKVALGKLRIEPVVFYQRINNWIQWVPGQGYWSPGNQGLMISRGAELNTDARIEFAGKSLIPIIKYSFTDARQAESKSSELSQGLMYVPKHQAVIGFCLEAGDFSAGLDYNFLSSRSTTTDHNPVYALPPLHLVNFVASYKLMSNRIGFDMYGRINNLLNNNYQMIRSYAAPGLSAVIGLRINYMKTKQKENEN